MRKRCESCGKSISRKASFCPSCGVSVQKVTPIEQSNAKKTTATLTSVQKRALVAVVIIGLASITFYSTLYASLQPARQVTKLVHGFTNLNTDDFFSIINVDEDVIYDEKSYMKFLFYLDKGMDGKLAKELTKASEKAYDDKKEVVFSVPETDYNDALDLFVIRPIKKYGFYHSVSFEAIAYESTIATDMKGLKVDLLDKEYILKGEDIMMGKLLPSNYPYTVFVTNKWIARDFPGTLRVPNHMSGAKLDFMSWNQSARLRSNIPKSHLFINGKPTEHTVEEMRELGPIVRNAIKVHAEYEDESGKKLRTPEKYLKPGEEAYLHFATKDNNKPTAENILTKTEAENFTKRYRAAYERALNGNTMTPLIEFIVPNSLYEADLRTYFEVERDVSQFKYTFIDITERNITLEGERAYVKTAEEHYYTDAEGKSELQKVNREYELHIDKSGVFKMFNVREIE